MNFYGILLAVLALIVHGESKLDREDIRQLKVQLGKAGIDNNDELWNVIDDANYDDIMVTKVNRIQPVSDVKEVSDNEEVTNIRPLNSVQEISNIDEVKNIEEVTDIKEVSDMQEVESIQEVMNLIPLDKRLVYKFLRERRPRGHHGHQRHSGPHGRKPLNRSYDALHYRSPPSQTRTYRVNRVDIPPVLDESVDISLGQFDPVVEDRVDSVHVVKKEFPVLKTRGEPFAGHRARLSLYDRNRVPHENQNPPGIDVENEYKLIKKKIEDEDQILKLLDEEHVKSVDRIKGIESVKLVHEAERLDNVRQLEEIEKAIRLRGGDQVDRIEEVDHIAELQSVDEVEDKVEVKSIHPVSWMEQVKRIIPLTYQEARELKRKAELGRY